MACIIQGQEVLSRTHDGPVAARIGSFAQSQSAQGYVRYSIHRQALPQASRTRRERPRKYRYVPFICRFLTDRFGARYHPGDQLLAFLNNL